jgi:hypothetical protein
MSEIKFTSEEMEQISKLQSRYQSTIFQLGETQIRKKSVDLETEYLKKVEDNLIEEYKKIQTDEGNLLQQLTEKYGEGSLNINTGTFNPKQ